MAGKLYGVGVGPGDSKLLTLKAKEVLESVDVVAVPVKAPGEVSTALSIVRPVVDLKNKEIMPVIFKMEHIREKGYETDNMPGISAFSGGAALAQISLVEGDQNMMVISSLKGTEALEASLKACDNLVVMKAGSSMAKITEILKTRGLEDKAVALSNIGMDDEYIGPPDENRKYGYFTTLIIKKGGL